MKSMDDSPKCLICLGAGVSQLPLIQAAKRRGYSVIAIDRDPDAPGFSLSDIKIIESTYDAENVLNALHSIEKQHHFCGLVARTSGPALKTAAAIAEEFHLPGLSREIVPLATEKSKLREFCEVHGILMPKGKKVPHLKDLDPDFPMPLIVKPDLPLIGKKDVRVVWKSADLNMAVESAIQSSGNGFAEVEEYIEGIDVSILFLLKHGMVKIVNYWDELIGLTADNHIKAIGVSVPSVIEGGDVSGRLKKVTELLAQSFRKTNALIILSFRVDFSGNPYLIEMHGDLGGDLIADVLFPAAFPDFNFFDMALDVATGNNILNINSQMIPTCLIYDVSQFADELIQNAMICGDAFYIQKGDLLTNLNRLNFLIDKSKICLMKMPRHEEWLKRY